MFFSKKKKKKQDLDCQRQYEELKGQLEQLQKENDRIQDQLDYVELRQYYIATQWQKWDWQYLNDMCDKLIERNKEALAK